MPPSDEEFPGDDEVNFNAIRSDLSEMQSSIEDHQALLERGPELRENHFIESQVDIDVPPVVADYARAVVRGAAAVRNPRLKSWACQWTPALTAKRRRSELTIRVHRP